jgi:thioredoxin-dependent peroxiredoxin
MPFLFPSEMIRQLKSFLIRVFEKITSSGKTTLRVGQQAPDFSLPDQDMNSFTLSANTGKKIALYFYPKDNTIGCTLQSCNLRDHYAELKEKGFEVIGISTDDVDSHKKFRNDYRLPFRLLADTEKKVAKLYGVYGRKNFFGKKFNGIIRTTFVIDEKGVIQKIITAIDTGNHSSQILG